MKVQIIGLGDEGLMPCSYEEDMIDLHKRCIQLFYKENKSVEEVKEIIERENCNLEDFVELDPDDYEFA